MVEFNKSGYCRKFDVYCSYYFAKCAIDSEFKNVSQVDFVYVYRKYVYKVDVFGRICYKIGEVLYKVIPIPTAQS